MKLVISWNVNGIRANIKKGFFDFVNEQQPHILCLQETRGYPPQIDEALHGYLKYWNHAQKKGYSGTAIFVRPELEPLNVQRGIGQTQHDQEGRVLTLEYSDHYLVCVYTPNAGEELKRLTYRMEWDVAFRKYLKRLDKKKPVIFAGDLNVAHQEIDIARPEANRRSAGFTAEERAGFTQLLKANFVDSFRHFHPDKTQQYTWWSYRMRARERNVGWRIDYFCLSQRLFSRCKKAFILADVMGSDHCPVGIEFE